MDLVLLAAKRARKQGQVYLKPPQCKPPSSTRKHAVVARKGIHRGCLCLSENLVLTARAFCTHP
jgi:hypothetical protein